MKMREKQLNHFKSVIVFVIVVAFWFVNCELATHVLLLKGITILHCPYLIVIFLRIVSEQKRHFFLFRNNDFVL